MDGKKLEEIRDAYRERKQLEEKIIEFESMRISPRGAVYGTERVQTSPRGDVQPDRLAALEDLLNKYNEKLRVCISLITEFETALERLKPRERLIMRLYYVDGMTWEQICVKLNLSWTSLHRNRRKAIEKITRE